MNLTLTKKQLATGAGALALLGAGVGIGVAVSPSPSPVCPSLTQLAGGGTFSAAGCTYDVGSAGLEITKPTSITGGDFTSSATTAPIKPIIKIDDVSGVTLSGLVIEGQNVRGKFSGSLVGQAGIKLVEASDVALESITVEDTWGDCLEAFAEPPKHVVPNTDIEVNGATFDNCGRDGISPSDITDSTFDNVTVGECGQAGIDFESDLKNLGAGSLMFSAYNGPGIDIGEKITGPIGFTGGTVSGRIQWRARQVQTQPVAFASGTVLAGGKAKPAIVVVHGSVNLTFTGETFTRGGGAPLWNATDGAHLTFVNSTLPPPLGTNDSSSTVTISP